MSTELKIKVEVPALEVLPHGSVSGGETIGEGDVLMAHSNLGDTDPNVVLGPDSVGTLSFTSGSTGIPKGVRGRHFSLTHFFPWMASRFGLNETSKFTMLSGIAHDPIQRDSESFVHNFLSSKILRSNLGSVHPSFSGGGAPCSNGRGYQHTWKSRRVDGRLSGHCDAPDTRHGTITIRASHTPDSLSPKCILRWRCPY